MICSRCGRPLPNKGVTCKFCGMLMSQDQINFQKKMAVDENKRIQLLSEKYGANTTPEYRKPKENKLLGAIIIIVILLVLITVAIVVNIIR